MTEKVQDSEKDTTGSREKRTPYKLEVCPFDKYEVVVRLSPTNEFLGIVEVRINKDFLSFKEKTLPKGYHDVDEFYKE
jgi:hypothetical protein